MPCQYYKYTVMIWRRCQVTKKSWLASFSRLGFFSICMPWGHIFSINRSWVSAALSAIFIPEHSWFRKMSLTWGSQTLVSTVCRCHIWSATACGGWRKSSTLQWALQKTRWTSNSLHMTRLGLNLIDYIYPALLLGNFKVTVFASLFI